MKTKDIGEAAERVSMGVQSLLNTLDAAKVHAMKAPSNPSDAGFFKANRTTPELIEAAKSVITPISKVVESLMRLPTLQK